MAFTLVVPVLEQTKLLFYVFVSNAGALDKAETVSLTTVSCDGSDSQCDDTDTGKLNETLQTLDPDSDKSDEDEDQV